MLFDLERYVDSERFQLFSGLCLQMAMKKHEDLSLRKYGNIDVQKYTI